MDSLTTQDAFEPSGRKRFAAPKDRRLPARIETSLAKPPAASALRADAGTEIDSTTEH